MRINKKYLNLILIGITLVPLQVQAWICTGRPIGFWDAFTCGDFGVVGSLFLFYGGFVRYLIWIILFGMMVGVIKYFRNKQEAKDKRTDMGFGVFVFKVLYGIIFILILCIVILGELSHFGYRKELNNFTEDLYQQSLKYQEEAGEREERRQMELEDIRDISYERRGVKAYSPSYLPGERYKKRPSFYNEGSDSIIQWITFDGENAFSLENSNEEDVPFRGGRGDIFGQTNEGENVYIKSSSNGERSIFTTKIDNTHIEVDVGYYMPEIVDVLESEILKIINSMEPIN